MVLVLVDNIPTCVPDHRCCVPSASVCHFLSFVATFVYSRQIDCSYRGQLCFWRLPIFSITVNTTRSLGSKRGAWSFSGRLPPEATRAYDTLVLLPVTEYHKHCVCVKSISTARNRSHVLHTITVGVDTVPQDYSRKCSHLSLNCS